MDNKNFINDNKKFHRVITSLNREQIDFLDKIGKDALFSVGCKLSRTKVISAMIEAFKQLEISGNGVVSKKALEKKIIEAIEKGLEEEEFDSRVSELQDFLSETQQYLQTSNTRLERIIDTPNTIELKSIFDSTDVILERDIAIEQDDEEISFPSIEGSPVDEERL